MDTLGTLAVKYDKACKKIDDLKIRLYDCNIELKSKKQKLENRENKIAKLKQLCLEKDEMISNLNDEINKLKDKIDYLNAISNHDSTMVGIPTASTPIGKAKYNSSINSREPTDRKIGGQPGHPKSELSIPDDIDKEIEYKMDETTECPKCGSDDLIFTGNTKTVYESTLSIKPINIKKIFYEYQCGGCGNTFFLGLKPNERSACHYGTAMQAVGLSLMNTCNVPINKVKTFFEGITNGKISPSEGYLAKLPMIASKKLSDFRIILKNYMIQRSLLYWDDTVININTERGCLRFYGDETISYYTAHEKKDLEGIEEDKVLTLLTEEQKAMHDHNKVNYNAKFKFGNLECNQHLQRDLKKIAIDTNHDEFLELKDLISETIHKRKEAISKGENHFSDEFIKNFSKKVKGILNRAEERNKNDYDAYFGRAEKTLIKRIRDYYDNYFAWVSDFTLPTTNNLAEKGLRCVKSHTKASGQFQNVKTAQYYADVKTYIETCRKNGINEIYAMIRLFEGNPITVKEIFSGEYSPENRQTVIMME